MHGYHYWKYKCILLNITGLLQDKMHIYLNCSYMTMSSSTYHLVSFHNSFFSTCIRYYNILFRIHLMRPNWAWMILRVVHLLNCDLHPCPSCKMTAIAQNRNFFYCFILTWGEIITAPSWLVSKLISIDPPSPQKKKVVILTKIDCFSWQL
jgi:hypothetical protein